jgi:calmodulin
MTPEPTWKPRNLQRMAKNKPNEEQLDELREAFDYNDRDGDGRIQVDEFSAMLDELEAGMTDKDIEIGFKDIDTNDDGLIDFQEFVAWWAED